ncbi:hypothetical protein LguiB_000347 [Lonicera macranthoides]
MSPNCCYIFQWLTGVRLLSLLLMKLKLGSEILFMVVFPIFSPCNNRYQYVLLIYFPVSDRLKFWP